MIDPGKSWQADWTEHSAFRPPFVSILLQDDYPNNKMVSVEKDCSAISGAILVFFNVNQTKDADLVMPRALVIDLLD
jgi:hypothetical protein